MVIDQKAAETLALKTLMSALNISELEIVQNSRRPEEMIDLISHKLEAFVRSVAQKASA